MQWPFGVEIGKCGARFQNNYQYAALWVGVSLLIAVNVELMLRQLITLLGQGDRLTSFKQTDMAGAE